MKSIGIRELRHQASRFLRMVEGGQTLQVTDRGRAIALLVPVPQVSPLEALIATGRATAAVGDLLELDPPLAPAKDVPLPSVSLSGARDVER
jgi:antitoxin (DNA-binding transcriptional repressor) of toxin-antitoxin stability system